MVWQAFGLVLLFGLIMLVDVPPLVHRRWWPELITYLVLLALGMAGAFAMLLD